MYRDTSSVDCAPRELTHACDNKLMLFWDNTTKHCSMIILLKMYIFFRLSGLSPFMGETDTDTLSNVISGVYDFDYAEFADVSDSAKDMIAKLLMKVKSKKYDTLITVT